MAFYGWVVAFAPKLIIGKSFVVTIWLENRGPTELFVLNGWLDNFTVYCPFKYYWAMTLASTESVITLCLSAFIVKPRDHLTKTISAHLPQKVFDIRTGKSFQRVEAQSTVLDNDRTIDLLHRVQHFSSHDLLWCAL